MHSASHKKKLILWDVDGMLFNSDEIYFQMLSEELGRIGVNLTPQFYGENGLDDCIYELGISDEELNQVKQAFKKRYYSDEISDISE